MAALARSHRDVLPAAMTPRITKLGPFAVSTDAPTLARFAAVTRSAAEDVPTTFPIVWLSHPDVRAAILRLAGTGEVAFHEEQTFDYHAALVPGADYALSVDLDRIEAPARLVLTSTVARDGAPVLAMRTVLRLVSATAGTTQPQAAQQ